MSSSASDTPKRTIFPGNEDQEMLESLTGLSIKGFQDWCAHIHPFLPSLFNPEDSTEPNANTPSSTNASLPTPPALKMSHVLLASPERSSPGHNWYSEERSIPPNAPLLKDLDSFTEGTGHGSFDFPLTTGPDDGPVYPLFFHPTENVETNTTRHSSRNSLDLDSLPLPSNPNDFVLAWIETLSPTSPPQDSTASELPPKKRRRSFTQDDDTDDDRRNRSWSPSIEAHFVPPCALTEEEDPELVVCRTEPDAPG